VTTSLYSQSQLQYPQVFTSLNSDLALIRMKRFLNSKLFRFRFVRFGMVGVFNTVLDWAVYFTVLATLGDGHKIFFVETDTWARAAGIGVGVTSAFFLNSRWVFKDNGYHNHFFDDITWQQKVSIVFGSYVKFVASYALGMCMNILAYTTMKRLHIDEFPPHWGLGLFSKLPALVTSTAVSAIGNYLFLKHFVFKHKVKVPS
jgi:putative flippase GtrA